VLGLGLLVGAPALAPSSQPFTTDSLAQRAEFLEARLAAAADGDISLALDLADSTLVIEMDGVPLRRCRVLDYRADHAAEQAAAAGDSPALFTLVEATASIPHAPIRTVKAPADTTEASTQPPLEIPEETRAAYATLRFDRGVVVHLRPAEASASSRLIGEGRWAWARGESAARTLRALPTGDRPEAWIEIELAPADIKAVFRALPDEALLALRLR